MSEVTQWITMQVEEFFQKSDKELEETLKTEDSKRLLKFIADYVERFPTPAEYIYQKIFEREKDLCEAYTDYTLEVRRPEIEASVRVEKYRLVHREKAEEFLRKMKDYIIQKEAYEKNPEKHPDKPRKPDEVRVFYMDFYNNIIIKKALKDHGIKLRDDWKEFISKPGYLLLQDTRQANSVRSMMFDIAFALEWDVKTLRNILRKILLQMNFNPKNATEAIYWYCLRNKINYQEMCSSYLEYSESKEFREKYAPNVALNTDGMMYTVYWEDRLKSVITKEKEEFFAYLWLLKYADINTARRTPSHIYWENFRCFPKIVWIGEQPEAQNVITGIELYEAGLIEDASAVQEGVPLNSLEEIINMRIRLNPDKFRRGSQDDEIDGLEKVFLYSEDEYQKILPLILKMSRKNYYASNKETLLPSKMLKKIFGDLDYTETGVENRKSGKSVLSRTDIMATMFISFFSDLFLLYPDKNRKIEKLRLFRELVKEDLKESGWYKFYPRNPFELFIILCFWQEDPLAYFMASWEASKIG